MSQKNVSASLAIFNWIKNVFLTQQSVQLTFLVLKAAVLELYGMITTLAHLIVLIMLLLKIHLLLVLRRKWFTTKHSNLVNALIIKYMIKSINYVFYANKMKLGINRLKCVNVYLDHLKLIIFVPTAVKMGFMMDQNASV